MYINQSSESSLLEKKLGVKNRSRLSGPACGDIMQLLAQTMSMVEKVASEIADVKSRIAAVETAVVDRHS